MYIRRHIDDLKIFESTFQRFVAPNLASRSINSASSIDTPLYEDLGLDIVIVGHSLGAGIAAVLTKLYLSAYPQRVHCYCYGIPGSVVDKTTAEELRPYVSNVSHNNDLIPTLSVSSVMRLRRQVLFAISRAKVSKTHIMQSMFRSHIESVDDLMYPISGIPDSSFLRNVRSFDVSSLNYLF
jgi:pimeloyl-ACP methyl ester carboxylesterase